MRKIDVRKGVHVRVLRYLATSSDVEDSLNCKRRCVISDRADGDYQYGWYCDLQRECSGEKWHAPGTKR